MKNDKIWQIFFFCSVLLRAQFYNVFQQSWNICKLRVENYLPNFLKNVKNDKIYRKFYKFSSGKNKFVNFCTWISKRNLLFYKNSNSRMCVFIFTWNSNFLFLSFQAHKYFVSNFNLLKFNLETIFDMGKSFLVITFLTKC